MLKNKVVACHTVCRWWKYLSEKTWDQYVQFTKTKVEDDYYPVKHIGPLSRFIPASGESRGKGDSILFASAALYKSSGTSIKCLWFLIWRKAHLTYFLLSWLALRAVYQGAQQTCYLFAPQEDLFCPSSVVDSGRSIYCWAHQTENFCISQLTWG